MAGDVLFLNAQYTGNRFLHGLRALSRGPCQNLAIAVFGDGDRWLHRGMREMRSVKFRLDDLAALGKFRVHVAHVADYFARLTGRGFKCLAELIGVVDRVGTGVPIDLQSLAPLKGSPGVIGDDGDPAQWLEVVRRFERLDGQRLLHAAHLQSRLVVIGLNLLSEDGRMLDGGIYHAGHLGIHAERGFASDDIREIEQGVVFADVAPLRPALERNIFLPGNTQFGGGGRQFAVTKLAGACLVHDEARLGSALFLRYTPFPGGRGDQHDAAGSADLAHLVEETANRV